MRKKLRFVSSLTSPIRHFTTFHMPTFATTLKCMLARISSRRILTLLTRIWSIGSGATNRCHHTNGRQSSSTQPSACYDWDALLSSSLTCTHPCSTITWSRFSYGCTRTIRSSMWGMSLRQSCPKSKTKKGGLSCSATWRARLKGRMRWREKRKSSRKYRTNT